MPAEWAGPGTKRSSSQRTIRFGSVVPQGWDPDGKAARAAIMRVKRMAVLMRVRVLKVGAHVMDPTQPSSWVQHVHYLIGAARTALGLIDDETEVDGDRPIFARLSPAQMEVVRREHAGFAKLVVHRLNALFSNDAFDDWPAVDVLVERGEKKPIQPLPDRYTAALGHSARWFIETVGPDLLSCWEEMLLITETNEGKRRLNNVRDYRRSRLIAWEGSTLVSGFKFVYVPVVRSTGENMRRNKTTCATWPPENFSCLRDMIFLLQAAHVIVISLCTAGRDSEITDLRRDCLVRRSELDLLKGPTYKLSDSPFGEERHWPLPRLAVAAIEQQRRLAQITAPDGERLLVPFSSTAEGDLKNVGSMMRSFSTRMMMPDGTPLASLGDGLLASTRIRKTVVRLAALALVGANQILMDILGHRDPEMTLGYILSDPGIQDDMRTVAREAAIAVGREAITGAQGNGGRAAEAVKELARRLTPRGAPAELEAEGLSLAAEILTLNGSVMLVRKNVLCTKTFNQFGPCTRRAGAPDAGNCQPDCAHRLELAAARADHKAAIRQILEEAPTEPGLMRSWWQAQLVAHLTPFRDLAVEMFEDDRVRSLLEGINETALIKLGFEPTSADSQAPRP